MSSLSRPAFLRLVFDNTGQDILTLNNSRFEPTQATLIAPEQRTLLVCATQGLDEQSFVEVIQRIKPSYALDLRATPRFDFGSLNRRKALSLFESAGTTYLDIGHRQKKEIGIADALNGNPAEKGFFNSLRLRENGNALIIFIDTANDYRLLGISLVQQFREITGYKWELVLQGPSQRIDGDRHLIFISHANPEDNEFVLWMYAQLTKHGYQVWADLTELTAGEIFWDRIEETIRNRACKVIAVVSKQSIFKPGVQDEISLAISIERAERLPGFVIPIRLDDVAHIDFRANLFRKNALDFSKSWARGFAQLLDSLKKGNVPRITASGSEELSSWWINSKKASSRIEIREELLISNQFAVSSVPPQTHVLIGTPSAKTTLGDFRMAPIVPYHDLFLSFLSSSELCNIGLDGLTNHGTVATSEILSGNVRIVQHLTAAERQRLLHRMLNKQWEWFLLQKGFLKHEVPRRAPVMYLPKGLLEKDQADFSEFGGPLRRRKLVGFSEKRNLYWHLGLIGRFTDDPMPLLRLKTTVIFSEDGKQKLIDASRNQLLRRRFCKNWWNDRWRGLQSAVMHWLSQGANDIVIFNGASGNLAINKISRVFSCPVAIIEDDPIVKDIDIETDSDDLSFESPEEEIEFWDEMNLLDNPPQKDPSGML